MTSGHETGEGGGIVPVGGEDEIGREHLHALVEPRHLEHFHARLVQPEVQPREHARPFRKRRRRPVDRAVAGARVATRPARNGRRPAAAGPGRRHRDEHGQPARDRPDLRPARGGEGKSHHEGGQEEPIVADLRRREDGDGGERYQQQRSPHPRRPRRGHEAEDGAEPWPAVPSARAQIPR